MIPRVPRSRTVRSIPGFSVTRMALALHFALLGAAPASAQQAPSAGIGVFRGERSAIIVRVPSGDLDAVVSRRVSSVLQVCRDSLRMSGEDIAAVVATADDGAAAEADRRGLLSITVIAQPPADMHCGDEWATTALLGARGVWVTRDIGTPPGRSIREVRVSQDARPVEAAIRTRRTVRLLTSEGLRSTDIAYESLALPMHDVAPDSVRRPPSLVITVAYESGGTDDVIELPWESLRDLWQLTLVAHVAQRASAAAASLPLVALTPPRDSALRAASLRIAARDATAETAAQAAAEVTRRAHANELSREDRTWARAQSALALARVRDTLGVQLTMGALLDDEPCFRWNADAAPELREATRRLASRAARCEAMSSWLVAGRAVIAPGLGRPKLHDGRENRRYAFTTIVVASLALGQAQNRSALQQYRIYLDEKLDPSNPNDAVESVSGKYERAENTRVRAAVLVGIGIGTWAAHGAAAIFAERRFASRLAAMRDVGTVPASESIGWRPLLELSSERVGLGLSLQW